MHQGESVSVIIFDEKRESVLYVKRCDIPVWVLPGGGIDEGETPDIAALREGKEETGYDLRIVRQIAKYLPSHPLTRTTYLFECSIVSGSPTLSDETQAIEYFSIKKLPSLSPPPYEEWVMDAFDPNRPFFIQPIRSVTYFVILKKFFQHPILILNFFLLKLYRQLKCFFKA